MILHEFDTHQFDGSCLVLTVDSDDVLTRILVKLTLVAWSHGSWYELQWNMAGSVFVHQLIHVQAPLYQGSCLNPDSKSVGVRVCFSSYRVCRSLPSGARFAFQARTHFKGSSVLGLMSRWTFMPYRLFASLKCD